MNKDRLCAWGEKVWEEKIRAQDEKGVIHGGRHSLKGVDKQKEEIVKYLDKEILPKIKKNSKVMDAGVGPLARFSIEFAKRGYKVVGVDVSQTTLKLAEKHIKEKNIKNIRLIQDNLCSLDKIQEKFDFIFCFGTFGHLPKILAIETLKKFNNLLEKEGFCLIHFWVEEKLPIIKLIKRAGYKLAHNIMKKRKKSFEVNCSTYSREEINELLKRTGFSLISSNNDGLFLLKKN